MSNPLPVSLPQECRKAAKLLNAFADPGKGLDSIIPVNVLRKAKGFAFLTVVKAGFVFSARAGSGVVIARLPDGSWSAPSACGTAGGGVGFQVGVEMAEFIIILKAAVASFMAAGSINLGGNMSIAAGPIGRNVEGTGSISTKGKVAAMYSYSRSKGLFGGASIEGSVIIERSDANRQAYGFDVKAKQLLSGQVEPPAFADLLIDTIVRKSGRSSDYNQRRHGEDDDDDYDHDEFENESGHRRGDSFPADPKAYYFGSAYASGGSSCRPSTPGSPTMDKSSSSKGFGSKLSNFVPGSASRSRSSSIAAARAEIGVPSSSLMAKDSSRDGPVSTGTTKFETEFTNEFEQSADPFNDGEHWRGCVDNRKSSAAKLTKASSPLNSYSSLRLGGPAAKEVGAVPEWEAHASLTRESFDSLDDDRAERNGFGSRYDDGAQDDYGRIGGSASSGGRFRSATVGSNSRPVGLFARARSASSPWSSKSKKAATANARSASPYINEHPSPFDDDVPSNKTTYSTRAWSGSAGRAPWDSEEEDFYNNGDSPASRLRAVGGAGRAGDTQRNIITTPRGERKDPFDLSEVEADFASSISSHHRGRPTTETPPSGNSTPNGGRSRSGTIGGIGKAIALYDFPGVESTDLPFKKGDVITVLSCDDEEWWKGRLNLTTGMFPRNRVEAHLDK
ncbi:BQ2448_4034 [Microbotryum intermedium]|uniref:BQ2448_4034 protein n=1 Tax=Microbotryum intermedium TaxID=269621 RepID=A0A238FGZ6_9BASI|nr:BQ2448_4034 [Microbotryum intermedium]